LAGCHSIIFFYFAAMNDPVEHATGIEKFELMQKAKGNDVRLFPTSFTPRQRQLDSNP
jgi:hypothetical protein